MAHKNAACHAREHNRYNVFLGAYVCFPVAERPK